MKRIVGGQKPRQGQAREGGAEVYDHVVLLHRRREIMLAWAGKQDEVLVAAIQRGVELAVA